MAPHRTPTGAEGWLDPVPAGAGLEAIVDLVGDDLAPDSHLSDLVGDRGLPGGLDGLRNAGPPRVRPILVALAARASGAAEVKSEAQHTAELLHLALVLHDYAVGREGGRRRRLARLLFRRSVTWLSGQHLTLRALELSRHTHPRVIEEVIDTLRAFSQGHQLAQRLREEARPPDLQDWADHADAHTGALFAFCCRAGGWIAGAEPAAISALGRYGRHAGRLWHIAEDVSALRYGDGARHVLTRALVGRPVLPMVRAAAVEPTLAEAWVALGDDPDLAAAERVADRIRDAGGLKRVSKEMALESWAARRVLRQLPESRYRTALDQLVAGLARAAVTRS